MKKIGKDTVKRSATGIVLIALFSALLTAGKLALSAIPNVEPVTLFLLLYASVFGRRYAMPASMIFCVVEVFLYGFGTWVPLYFIYWNLFTFGACLLIRRPRLAIALPYTLVCTVLFGVLSTLIDTLFMLYNPANTASFGAFFSLTYLKGVGFYVTHVVSNVVLVGLLYVPLTKLLTRLKASLSIRDFTKEKID